MVNRRRFYTEEPNESIRIISISPIEMRKITGEEGIIMNKRKFKKYMESKAFYSNYNEIKNTIEKTVKDLFYDQSWFDRVEDALSEAFSRLQTNNKKHYQPMGLIKMSIFMTLMEEGLEYYRFIEDSFCDHFKFNLHDHKFDEIFKKAVLGNYLLLKENPSKLDSAFKVTTDGFIRPLGIWINESKFVYAKIYINKHSFDIEFCDMKDI